MKACPPELCTVPLYLQGGTLKNGGHGKKISRAGHVPPTFKFVPAPLSSVGRFSENVAHYCHTLLHIKRSEINITDVARREFLKSVFIWWSYEFMNVRLFIQTLYITMQLSWMRRWISYLVWPVSNNEDDDESDSEDEYRCTDSKTHVHDCNNNTNPHCSTLPLFCHTVASWRGGAKGTMPPPLNFSLSENCLIVGLLYRIWGWKYPMLVKRKFRGKIGKKIRTRNILCRKFAVVYRKIATSYTPIFHPTAPLLRHD